MNAWPNLPILHRSGTEKNLSEYGRWPSRRRRTVYTQIEKDCVETLERAMTETRIGTITHYYSNLHVAGMTLTDGELHQGDRIHIKGHTSDFEQKVRSMEIDHEAVDLAVPGDQIGLKVAEHARENDAVYLVS